MTALGERAKGFLRKQTGSQRGARGHSRLGGVFALGDLRTMLRELPRDMLDLAPQLAARIPSLLHGAELSTETRAVVHKLREDGVAILSDAVPEDLMDRCRSDFEAMIPRIETLPPTMRTMPRSIGGTIDHRVHEYQADLRTHRTRDPLMFSSAFAELVLLPKVSEILAGYLGSKFLYQSLIASRTAAAESDSVGFSKWHHDARGCKLNVILLLTDVPDDGQATVYMRGSHRLYYSRDRRRRNFFSTQEVTVLKDRYGLREFVCSAPAGSAILFDSNGLHRGRRGPVSRDTVQVNCMTRRSHLWPQEMPEELFLELSPSQRDELRARTRLTVV